MGKAKAAKRVAIGAAVAGAAGYIAGILTAPKSGKQTRGQLTDTVSGGMNEVEKQLKQMHTELGDLVTQAKGRSEDFQGKSQKELMTLLDKAKDSKQKVREVISAVHEGDAKDKDLKRAVSDARHAIDHIKDFLDK